ncbi:hypothetical protein C1E23_00315 [Pseudoalteromonas phenolica]|uniref:DUF4404 domain-containing protein n=1 Tax=Pseudoalteromonas phenolica TaxID=161398 RepID=A0A4Q7IRZ5_9GAMM|nr:hypothetical protein [Pseudoalteromonas phenolica]RZQ55174.1 hypothetical protein C1E23_00315 [Pseudoalteromonas phenolica]
MATFNQQGQTVVGTQNNAETITIGQAQNKSEFIVELQQLKQLLDKAVDEKLITGEKAIDAEMHVKKAVLQAQENKPDKNTLISHLKSAKELVTSADKITAGLSSIISKVGVLF